ncbi:unnamed protein product, partial [Heterosigma akashiwo]
GGFAHCYWASSVETGDIYALKIVEKASLTKRRAKEKLQGEIRIHRKLNHPHVVEFYDYFEDRKRVYIVLGLCPNHSMSDLMKRRKRLTELEAKYYGMQLIDALKYLHNENVIHRDLKLGNLFLDEQMGLQVGDFGLAAKVTDIHERKRTICGTPNYIAPEILENRNGHSFQVDIWSFGVILYTWLVGKPPYEAKDVKATYKRIVSNMYTFPERANLSQEAQSIIRRMLQLNPNMRPSLEEIERHPFFSSGPEIPRRLPKSALSRPPTLADCLIASAGGAHNTENHYNNEKKLSTADPYALPSKEDGLRGAGPTSRRPLGALDSNTNGAGTDAAGGKPDQIREKEPYPGRRYAPGATTEAIGSMPLPAARVGAKKFDIYNDFEKDKENAPPQLARPRPVPVSPENSMEIRDDPKALRASTGTQGGGELSTTGGTGRAPIRRSLEGRGELGRAASAGGGESAAVKRKADEANEAGAEAVLDQKDKDTLEAMHDRLSQSLADHAVAAVAPGEGGVRPGGGAPGDEGLWVVRYVDYTSKYGLGFLLSNGSAGVYFNDATKIVAAPSGRYFDYVERARGGARDVTVARHEADRYPADLNKKVTLLNHFSNYLREEGRSHLPVSVNLDAREKNPDGEEEAAGPGSLVYVKKWVKTRHAILFRLSSRTVQVTFFDQTEITLSSEARAVMFIDKTGQRSKHTLLEVLRSGRQDMVKRLKYTKDILHQLISQQQQR